MLFISITTCVDSITLFRRFLSIKLEQPEGSTAQVANDGCKQSKCDTLRLGEILSLSSGNTFSTS
jgi:hypothetical protein